MALERAYRLEVAGQPLGANEARGLHWARVARDRATFRDAFALLAREAHRGSPLQRVHVDATLIRTRGVPLDPDNAVSRCKGPLDGLVAGGLVAGDDPAHLSLCVRQQKGPRRAIRLDIREVTAFDEQE